MRFDRKDKQGGGRNFDRNSGGGDRNFGGGGRSFGGGDRERSAPGTMHRATCSKCGAACEVPFRPSHERPVLCKNCFKRDGSFSSREDNFDRPKRFNSDNSGPSQGSDQTQKQLAAINSKLDKIMAMLTEIIEFDEDEDEDDDE